VGQAELRRGAADTAVFFPKSFGDELILLQFDGREVVFGWDRGESGELVGPW
jgi:hypothetical protein